MRKTEIHRLAALVSLTVTTSALAGPTFSFQNITQNDPLNAAIGQAQLSLEVLDGGAGQVLFVIRNAGPDPSSVTSVLFDNGDIATSSLASMVSLDHSDPGVQFAPIGGTANLPGGNSLEDPFETTWGIGADAEAPRAHNGINPGEQLGILTALSQIPGEKTLSDILNELNNGTLRIGLHVQAIGPNGGSESFVNLPLVPEPSAVLLTTLGLLLVSLLRERQVIR